jgi:hypothetical protein
MTVNVTLAFPEAIIRKIDRTRGYVNRSKFIVNLIEYAYIAQQEQNQNKNKKPEQPEFQVSSSQTQDAERVLGQTAWESDYNHD